MNTPESLIRNYLENWAARNGISVPFDVSISSNLAFGDYASNIALVGFKHLKGYKSPRDVGEKIIAFLTESHEIYEVFEKIEVAGAGFINFSLSEKFLLQTLREIVQPKADYGKLSARKGGVFVVEYSSPNIAKPFTIGHLRSTIIGDAVANLLEAVGADVKRDNHLGDWGSQFGKQIYAVKTWGNEEKIKNSENPVKELVKLYVKFHEEAKRNPELEEKAREWFKKLENGDREARELWEKCITWSLQEFQKLYRLLGVEFTENNGLGYGESFFEDKMDSVVKELRRKNLLTKDDGAELVFFPEEKYPPLMILKKDGTTLYATRDLATDKFRLQKYPDAVIINEVGIEQQLYFQQLFEVEKMLGWVEDGQRIHIKHGHYRFKEGKMSTRRGNVIWLEDVLGEAVKRASALSKQTHEFDEALRHNPGFIKKTNNAEKIAIGALKWNDLRRNPEQDIVFDWDDILNMQGNSGPYVQYTYVRTKGVLDKIKSDNLKIENIKMNAEESELLRFLTFYPYLLEKAAGDFAPNILCNYLFELSQKYNLFYQKHKIIGSEVEGFRAVITRATGNVLRDGLQILGIETVEEM